MTDEKQAKQTDQDAPSVAGGRPAGEDRARGFFSQLEDHKGEYHVVVLQDFPDPDAISSAFAHQRISAAFEIDCDILYADRLSHPQNIAMIRLLEIELTRFEREMGMGDFDAAVYIDNQGTTSDEITEALDVAGVPTFMIIDHHSHQNRLEPAFADIRDVGAVASIYGEYMGHEACPLQMEKSERRDARLATALMHGIVTDTQSFIHAQAADFRAAAFLSNYRDAEILDHIMNQARTKETMQVIQDALANRELVESYSISGVGYLRSETRDAIGQSADFLVTEENVHTAITYGIVRDDDEEENCIGSLRTSKLTLDPDEFLKEVFGRDDDDRYFGGGRLSAGGFEIPIIFLAGDEDPEYDELKWKVYDNRIRQKLFDKIGIHKEPTVED